MGRLRSDGAVFLSAGVPDPTAKHFMIDADPAAISAAISALLFVVLGRRRLVWGGHPAITPMVWAFAESMQVDYGSWVKLYQSKLFEDVFPEETLRFKNVVFTESVSDEIGPSLQRMRERMLGENEFAAAVFVGGMGGIIDEYRMFVKRAPDAAIVPVASAGGAAAVLAHDIHADSAFWTSLDYVELFHARLGIDPAEGRFRTPEDQRRHPLKDIDRLDPKSR
jgi:hypothetical protein